jgi:hydroxypyruvate isomerase
MRNIAANISVLFRELPLLQRFDAARDAGFNGVELQFPYIAIPCSCRASLRHAGATHQWTRAARHRGD